MRRSCLIGVLPFEANLERTCCRSVIAQSAFRKSGTRFCDQNALELLNLEHDLTVKRFRLTASCSRAFSAEVDAGSAKKML
jgi:hypothetical protein